VSIEMMNALAMRPDEDLVGSMKGCKVWKP
jgi:hypothetical protein